MSGERDELVELITRQVLAAIQRANATEARGSAPAITPHVAAGPVHGLAPGAVVHDPTTCERCRN